MKGVYKIMKKIKEVMKIILYFFIGNILFNLICSITQIVILNRLKIETNFYETYIETCSETTIFYTVVFILMLTSIYIHDYISVKRLNKRIKQIKK